MLTKVINAISILSLLILCSCLGELETADPALTKNSSMTGETPPFDGIEKAVPISNDKVEIYWRPSILDPLIVTYLIYVNNTDTPIAVKAESLTVTELGYYRHVIDQLAVDTEYSFKVGVRNASTGETSANDKEVFVKTFSNYTSDFNGVSLVSLVEGVGGRTSVKVAWSSRTIGSINFPRPVDPVQYEVRYMPADMGDPDLLLDDSNTAISRLYVPTTVVFPPKLCTELGTTVEGLASGRKYYFLVRSIHANALKYKDNPSYLTEKNGKVLSITTRESGDLFEFDPNGIKGYPADGETGLTAVDITWKPATGDYHHYRVFHKKVGEAGENPVDIDALPDFLDDDQLTLLGGDSTNFLSVDPGGVSQRIKNLSAYAFYQFKVVACKDISCTPSTRLATNLLRMRVVPKLAPFNGILSIRNPKDLATSDTISVNFDPPVMSAGYANKVNVYCFDGLDDTNPDLLQFNTAITSTKPSCNGLKLLTKLPNTTALMSTFSTLDIAGIKFPSDSTISSLKYCFSIVAEIETPFLPSANDLGIIKCVIPELPVPSRIEFPGKTNGCSVSGYNLDVEWPSPTGGIYSNYEVYWKEVDDKPFRFEEAIAGSPEYSSATVLSNANSYSLTSLIPGRRYEVGVLTSITIDGQKKYSEYNTSISKCNIPVPTVTFKEWVDIFSVGPKVDGRSTQNIGGQYVTLPETIIDSIPVEVEIDPSTKSVTSNFESKFGVVNGVFNGVYGALDGDTAGAKFQYSNQGIIRIGWRGFEISDTGTSFDDFIEGFEPRTTSKNTRKYGYRVFRSSDGGRFWTDLTSNSYPFQTVTNAGPLREHSIEERARNNQPINIFNGVVFTDYSVSGYDDVGNVGRGRIYLYKIVPYFDNREIPIANYKQAMVKVILPPRNMALVNRLMANRASCMEVEKPYIADKDLYYSCPFNGVGARGLTTPWSFGNTRLDIGGDLLVDRFEMGCNITRGDINNLASKYDGTNDNFKGLASDGSRYQGCHAQDSGSVPPISNAFLPSPWGKAPGDGIPYESFDQIIEGDCFGRGRVILSDVPQGCDDPTKVGHGGIYFPGARGYHTCDQGEDYWRENYLDPYYPSSNHKSFDKTVMNSEFGAVFYHRDPPNSSNKRVLSEFRAANGSSSNKIRLYPSTSYNAANCAINLPVVDNSSDPGGGGNWKPRWIFLDQLERLYYDQDGDPNTASQTLNLFQSTIAEVRNHPYLYDSLRNAVPTVYDNIRLSDEMTIVGAMTSNAAKLPPLTGLTQDMANMVCSNHKVEIGWDDAFGGFEQYAHPVKKRLMSRKEFVLAAAWPSIKGYTQVTNLELGVGNSTLDDGQNVNMSCNSHSKGISGYNNFGYGDPFEPSFPDDEGNTRISTGSSIFDGSAGISTQDCISRYGLQDIVGNVGEYSADQIYCDFSGEKMYVGGGDVSNSLLAPNSALYNKNNVIPKVVSDDKTGRCSIAQEGSERPDDLMSGAYIKPYYYNGETDPTVIPANVENTISLTAAEDLRAGDGFFLDFGQSNFAPPLSKNDTMALDFDSTVESRSANGTSFIKSRYFNPVVGLSFECGIGACSNSPDNKSISTDYYVTIQGLNPSELAVSDFPTNNSQILTDGMSEMWTRHRYSVTPTSDSEITPRFIDTVTVDHAVPANNSINYVEDTIANLGSILGAFEIWEYSWQVIRDEKLIFSNGGDSKSSLSGRYSTHLKSYRNVKGTRYYTGVRCAVRFETD